MSIETEIKKLASGQVQLTDAVVRLTDVLEAYVAGQNTDTTKTPVSSTASEASDPAPTGQVATEAKQTEVPVHVSPPAQVTNSTYTMQQVNEILGSTAAQMGDNGNAVRAIIGEYGAQFVNQIPQDKYAEVVAKVKALVGAPA